jgi:hypothetical protein
MPPPPNLRPNHIISPTHLRWSLCLAPPHAAARSAAASLPPPPPPLLVLPIYSSLDHIDQQSALRWITSTSKIGFFLLDLLFHGEDGACEHPQQPPARVLAVPVPCSPRSSACCVLLEVAEIPSLFGYFFCLVILRLIRYFGREIRWDPEPWGFVLVRSQFDRDSAESILPLASKEDLYFGDILWLPS